MKFFIFDDDIQAIIRAARDELRTEQELYTAETEATRNACPPTFNFGDTSKMIISIGRVRIGEAKYEATEIEYATTATDWPATFRSTSLYCSREAHNELMKKFEAAKAASPTKPTKQLLKG